jgi:hypothetical protein
MRVRRSQTGNKLPRTRYLHERPGSLDVLSDALNETISYGIQYRNGTRQRIVLENFVENSAVRHIAIKAPRLADFDLTEHAANRREIEAVVNLIGIKKRTVNVENHGMHRKAS